MERPVSHAEQTGGCGLESRLRLGTGCHGLGQVQSPELPVDAFASAAWLWVSPRHTPVPQKPVPHAPRGV